MKTYITAFFTLFIFALVGCKREKPVEEKIEFGVEVLNPEVKTLIIREQLPKLEQAKGKVPTADTLTLDTNNWAKVESTTWPDGYYTFSYGERSWEIYLKKGKTLYAQIDGADAKKPIEFQGGLKKVAKYLKKRNEVAADLSREVRPAYGTAEMEFVGFVDSARRVLDSMLVQFTTNNARFDKSFMKHQGLSNYYLVGQWIENYPSYRIYYTEDELQPMSEAYQRKRADFNRNDSSAIHVDNYIDYLEDVVYNRASAFYNGHLDSLQDDRYAFYELRMLAADSTFSLSILNDYFKFSPMADMVEYESPSINDSLFAAFKNQCGNTAFVDYLSQKLQSWEHLKAGKPAPNFSYASIDGDTISLLDLKGKYVYIDIWATWCAPCLAEIPDLKRLEKKYRYKPIQFLSVSIDKSKSAWEYKVENDNLKGIQLHAEDAWNSSVVKDYKIGGIPRFILIDPDGNIVDANASRPSGNIENQLNKLL